MVIHHPENDYFYATGRNSYTVKLAVKQGDACRAFLHCRDKYIPEDSVNTAGSTVMRRVASDGLYDFYEADINADMLCVRYFFEMQDGQGETLYYGNYGFYEKLPEDIDDMFDCPLASREEESFRAPEWAAGKLCISVRKRREGGSFSRMRHSPGSCRPMESGLSRRDKKCNKRLNFFKKVLAFLKSAW